MLPVLPVLHDMVHQFNSPLAQMRAGLASGKCCKRRTRKRFGFVPDVPGRGGLLFSGTAWGYKVLPVLSHIHNFIDHQSFN